MAASTCILVIRFPLPLPSLATKTDLSAMDLGPSPRVLTYSSRSFDSFRRKRAEVEPKPSNKREAGISMREGARIFSSSLSREKGRTQNELHSRVSTVNSIFFLFFFFYPSIFDHRGRNSRRISKYAGRIKKIIFIGGGLLLLVILS